MKANHTKILKQIAINNTKGVDKELRGYTPSPFQLRIHKSLNTQQYKYTVVAAGRQVGKTLLSINQMLYWAINDPGTTTFFAAPVYKQSKKVFNELLKLLKKTHGVVKSINQSDLLITFTNNSVIQFHSLERYDNLRGFTVEYLVVDEAAFSKDEAWTEVLKAIVLVKGKKVLVISTPKRKGWFKNVFQLGQDELNKNYISFTGTTYDNPLINVEEIDEARLNLPEVVFRQEYLAEFVDEETSVFKNIKQCIYTQIEKQVGDTYYCGIDVGRMTDYTVITVINQRKEVVDIIRINQTKWSKIVDEIVKSVKKWNIKFGYIEVNSIGDVIYDYVCQEIGTYIIQPFITTNKTKQDIIEDLQVVFEQQKIRIPENQILINELDNFTYIFNSQTRTIKYGAPNGLHDDCVISLAIANHAVQQRIIKGRGSLPTLG